MQALTITGLMLLLLSFAACGGAATVTTTHTVTTTKTVTATQTVTTTPTVTTTQMVTTTPTPPVTGDTHQVIIENSGYNPQSITIKSGDSVAWINKDPVPRTVTSWVIWFDEDEVAHIFIGDVFDSGNIEPGGTYTRVFDEAGFYDYASLPLYFSFGELVPAMMGSVTVRAD